MMWTLFTCLLLDRDCVILSQVTHYLSGHFADCMQQVQDHHTDSNLSAASDCMSRVLLQHVTTSRAQTYLDRMCGGRSPYGLLATLYNSHLLAPLHIPPGLQLSNGPAHTGTMISTRQVWLSRRPSRRRL